MEIRTPTAYSNNSARLPAMQRNGVPTGADANGNGDGDGNVEADNDDGKKHKETNI